MANKPIKSINLLPEFLRTDRNAKFLSSTIDQFMQPPQLDRIDGYVGSTQTPTFNSTSDVYLTNNSPYRLDPALIIYDNLGNIKDSQGYDDLINEISIKGGIVNNLDRLFRSDVYSYNAHIDWDKLVNYQYYYWMLDGPEIIRITTDNLDIDSNIIGMSTATVYLEDISVELSNGMLVEFVGAGLDDTYYDRTFYVDGVGTSITLIPSDRLVVSETFISETPDGFDQTPFDSIPFDNDRDLPNTAEYVTINRGSKDLNPWSRYNRWVHQDVIKISAEVNGLIPNYPATARAQRPIIEFKPDIQLFNFGTIGIEAIDIFDTVTLDAFSTVDGTTTPVLIDGVLLEHGHRIIFAADENSTVTNKIYEVNFEYIAGDRTLQLIPAYDHIPATGSTIDVLLGDEYSGTDWWYTGTKWQFAQQREKLNQAPLFDLYDVNGYSYGNKDYYLSNFQGNKIFSYTEGTGTLDPYLGFPLSYRNLDAIGSILFTNDLVTDSIIISQLGKQTYTISTNQAYCKHNNNYENAWIVAADYAMPILTYTATSIISYYEEPLSLTNNPLNGSVEQFTISELTDHVNTMISRIPNYQVSLLNAGNLRDLPDYTNFGIKLISNANPISFAQMFIGKKEHNLIDAISKSADQYNRFKHKFLNSIINVANQLDPVAAVDEVLTTLHQNNNNLSPYYLTDMLGYGAPEIVRTWTVTNSGNTFYPLSSEFDLLTLSLRSVLVYLNGTQLIHGTEYVFDIIGGTVEILTPLSIGDVLTVNDYTDTEGAYIPPTPTKLGLYPKFIPSIFVDTTYITPTTVIQGHDGSITIAYNDYRDNIILELEKRIYNNIKSQYRPALLDINSAIPGAFRSAKYTAGEVNTLLMQDFVKWAGQYSIDYVNHSTFSKDNSFTWNLTDSSTSFNDSKLIGSWRSVYKYFYDTDRPHSHPWEMLGFSEEPSWWETTYTSPYWSDVQMWTDLEIGYIAGTDTIDLKYARPGLSTINPVWRAGSSAGMLRDPNSVFGILSTDGLLNQPWVVGENGPAETAWRRSSYFPFAIQRMLALTIPATYASLMYDTSRVQQNLSNQWTYGPTEIFFRLKDLLIHGENNSLTSGYSVLISEIGQQRTSDYITELRQHLQYANYNLFYKVGGFVDPDTLQVVIDAFEPSSTSPGSILPSQNFKLRLNVSNPIKSIGISGFIIQKLNDEYVVKGYDARNSYFTYYPSIRNLGTPSITVGGTSSPYLVWTPSGTSGETNLSASDTTTASAGATGIFYQKGQYVFYGTKYYIVKVAHQSGATFNPAYFQVVPGLPTVGGATVQIANGFSHQSSRVPYGTSYSNIQDVYDLILGYGKWLTEQGFVFDDYRADLDSVVDWSMTSKEFLYWTTQNWADGSVITLSPFADRIVFKSNNSVVDNIFNPFYEYSLLRADGTPYPEKSLSISRNDGVCSISTLPDTDGIFFAVLNCVQKEHAMIFDNTTIFGDIIYDLETGSRQRRLLFRGFKTANWNGDFFSPGFIYDTAEVKDWVGYTDYLAGDVVQFGGKYYAAIKSILAADSFDFTKWDLLTKKPVAGLIPNFDYKISQFEDFYSLDSNNFDSGQQKMAQHLTGYTPRPYLNNIFTDPVAQYKFYQGFIKEKGTQNAISKLSKASLATLKGNVTYNEEWAFRTGQYGSFSTYRELEVPLVEGTFYENPQVLAFVDNVSSDSVNDLIHYNVPNDLQITPEKYVSTLTFTTTSSIDTLLLTYAGYVRVDDVTATAYSETSLLDIANNRQLIDGDTIWVGFKQDGSWDILRYTYTTTGVVGVYVSAPLSTITFTTDVAHNLSVGQMISVSHFNGQVDGIYIVQNIPNYRQFTVASTLASIENAALPVPGQLYIFKTARLLNFDMLPSDKEIFRLPYGSKFWIDPYGTKGWEVYTKINNYTVSSYQLRPVGRGLGTTISNRKGSDVVVTSSPYYTRPTYKGLVSILKKQPDTTLLSQSSFRFGNYTGDTELGYSLVYDDTLFHNSTYGLIFAGAPAAYSNVGAVKISSVNSEILTEGTSTYITNPNPAIGRFGSSIYVERHAKNKLVLVGSTSSVYSYIVSDNSGDIVCSSSTPLILGESINSISGADDASVIAIGSSGNVKIYNKTLTKVQTITNANTSFGTVVSVSTDGSFLFVAAPTMSNTDGSLGRVFVYKNLGTQFVHNHTLENPTGTVGMQFGKAIDSSADTSTLAISARGTNRTFPTTFDNNATLFDGGITKIKGTEVNSGAVYLYYKQNSRFVLSQELTTSTIALTVGTDYGSCLTVDDDTIFVGSPAVSNTSTNSTIYQFNKIDTSTYSWDKIRSQDNLVEVDKIQRVCLIDTFKGTVLSYLDVIDPLKGKVAGIAEQELTYKLISDPAIYSIGVAGTNNDTNKNWLDKHIGELWWDLSTTKYIWYEQSDLEYRRTNWGKLFPGSTIDVYEWVGSPLLPSEWSTQADTPAGLASGISGQPKFADNSVISVKQEYDNITNTFGNMYYYWVKNKVVVPNAKDRRISAYEVASIIADPTAQGLKFASILSSNAIALSNVGPMLIDTRLSLNIAQDVSDESTTPPKHTEWILLQENSALSMPPPQLEKKLLDSILGHDHIGNVVPDPTLTERTRYGTGIRPQQTFFKNRLEALRNIVEFSNSILISTPVTGNYNFKNLNAQEQIPDQYANEYDLLVEDNTELSVVNTSGYQLAIIECQVNTVGEVSSIRVVDSGFGYGTLNPVYSHTGTVVGYHGPALTTENYRYITTFDNNTTTFDNTDTNFNHTDLVNTYGRNLVINTVVDSLGRVTATNIVSSGTGYISNFKLEARPQTVIVQSDDTYNGKWTRYEFDYNDYSWNRAHTQSFNTTLYWDYVDWHSTDYNSYQIYTSVVGSSYELSELDLLEGQYVKINNGGDGRYIVLKKLSTGTYGSFGKEYDIVFSQRGTIQISDGIWDLANSGLGWDYINTYDQTLWDQTPDIELRYLLTALKEDLFVADLKINWNLLFFKSVRYALSEQKLLDWAFKTSFINVVNNAGALTQPPVYKLRDSVYYEDYINEVKPYHTQIRNFTVNHSVLDTSKSETTEIERNGAITIKFDRISSDNQTGDFTALDTFVCNGIDTEFILNWIPTADKFKTTVKLNGILVLSGDFTIVYYKEEFNGYTKNYAKIVFLNFTPPEGQVVTVRYEKGASLLNAAERILNYYTATSGMVGLDLGQLMTGIDFPGVSVGGQYEGPGFSNSYGGVYVDSNISGGTWTNGYLSSALGINPEDITINGEYGFLNTNSGYAPEEVVPGYVTESIGISVFTKGPSGSPLVMSSSIDILSTSSYQRILLPELPPTINSLSVILNQIILGYTTDSTPAYNQYSLDWSTGEIIISPQYSNGYLGYTIIGVGGGSGNSFGIIDNGSIHTNNSPTARIYSIAQYYTQDKKDRVVKDAFVTVNGVPIDQISPANTTTTLGFLIQTDVQEDRAYVEVYELPPGINVVQAWFFSESHEYFNEIREQIFTYDGSTSTFTLLYPPLVEGPPSTHAIVEVSTSSGFTRLLPPDDNLPAVYDYIITGTQLTIAPSVNLYSGSTIKVVTFSNHDSLSMQVEKFVGNINRRFQISRPVINDNYVWVTIIQNALLGNSTTYGLINDIDFIILDDNVTVQINDNWNLTEDDVIEIISFTAPASPFSALGYRIFKDMLGGTSYSRISGKNTTYLTQPLNLTDTEIYVADPTVLTSPDVIENIPGVVFINGERIEFFHINTNTSGAYLTQITRATMGTGPAFYLEPGTKVVDQGTEQSIIDPVTTHIQNTFTNTLTNVYTINKISTNVFYPGSNTSTVRSDGIILSTSTIMNLVDQVEVIYGGRTLRKVGVFKNDTTASYDGILLDSIVGTVDNVASLSTAFAIPGNTYLVTSTNQVWMYTGSRSQSTATVGWVFSGVTFLPPEFTITNTNTQQIILNTSTLGVEKNIQVTIVKKDFSAYDSWNNTVTTTSTLSLIDSDTSVALFLQEGPTDLPNNYYYGGDPVLTDESGAPIVDENDQNITGYY